MPAKPTVTMREVGPRDGLQMARTIMPTPDKLRWIAALVASGIREMEVASFVPPAAMPQMADAAEVTRAVRTAHPKLHVVTLAPNLRGARTPRLRCPVHHHARVRQRGAQSGECPSTRMDQVAEVGRVVEWVRTLGANAPRIEAGISTAFGCSLQGLVPENEVLSLATALAEAGVDASPWRIRWGTARHPRSAGSCGRCVQKSASNDSAICICTTRSVRHSPTF